MMELPARVRVYLKKKGYNPSEFKYLGWANAGATFSKKCKKYTEIDEDPTRPYRPVHYKICFETKEVIKVDSSG